MKHTILSIVFMSISWTSMAQLPVISAPQELVAGEFSEGAVTRLSSSEVAALLPWAQNAKTKITEGIKRIHSLPLRERLPELIHTIESVVRNSQSKRYQMFMRFALNRGLLLVSELQRYAELEDISVTESAIDLLLRSSHVALLHYESDLSFQTRMQQGEEVNVFSYQDFAAHFYSQLSAGILNILNVEAQYRLQNLLVEMTIWDLSRDEHAPAFADIIVEAHETLERLPSAPDRDTRVNLKNIRRLMGLKLGQDWVHEINEPNLAGVYFDIQSPQLSVCLALGYSAHLETPIITASPIGPRHADGHGRYEPHVLLTDDMKVKKRENKWFNHHQTLGKVRCVNKKSLENDPYRMGYKLRYVEKPAMLEPGRVVYFDNSSNGDGICKRLGMKGMLAGSMKPHRPYPGAYNFQIRVNENGETSFQWDHIRGDANNVGGITCYY